MDKELKEKLSDPELPQELTRETGKLVKELYLKDLKYAASILEIPIDGDGNTICTESEQTRFLALMYGILKAQEHKIRNAKSSILNEIKKMDSDVAEDLTNLKLL